MSRANARQLRHGSTEVERLLWSQLRDHQLAGHKFRRQHPVGQYVVDFACLERKLAVELDGGQHQEQAEYDTNRTQWLEARGWRVLRFWNNEVFQNLEGVKSAILASMESRKLVDLRSSPSP